MKIIQYCQHVLGIGHFFRSLELARAFKDHEVILVLGGPRVEADLPENVRVFQLPELMMDADFGSLHPSRSSRPVEAVKEQRQVEFYNLVKEEKPDVLIMELYPFGRKAFRFELDPVLEGIRSGNLSSACVVSSVRDILVEKSDAVKFETRVVQTLNTYFDAVLVHSDPGVTTLDKTFSLMDQISVPIVYTGFVAAKPDPGIERSLRRKIGIRADDRLVVVSAGGGKVGAPLLNAAAEAVRLMEGDFPLFLHVFTGPFMDAADVDRLKQNESERVRVSRFTPDFVSCLAAADLSISMAGYNTCMNLLATGTNALVWPFDQNREQRIRAEGLARLGAVRVLGREDLYPQQLAGMIKSALLEKDRVLATVDLEGALHTALWIEDRVRSLGRV